ncbi:MAG: PEP-CTERM sorting domain-containing protein [Aquabacterium sp.]|nr:PEP-CTERM sorting domain-containing protein [Aquabacterium sp.]
MKFKHFIKRVGSRSLRALAVAATVVMVPVISHAGVVFSFQNTAGGVTMTASGSLDTSLLVGGQYGGWDGTGFGTFDAVDMMGSGDEADRVFVFSAGTELSAWNAGSFVNDTEFFDFVDSGTTAFATYAEDSNGDYVPGIALNSGDLVGSVWTPDNNWFAANTTLADIGLIVGNYTITDATTGEFITISIGNSGTGGTIPEPGTLGLVGMAAAGLALARRRRAR